MPPMFAMELMSATPVAAAGPVRNVAGSAEMMPAGPHKTVAVSKARNAVLGWSSTKLAITANATVAITKGIVA